MTAANKQSVLEASVHDLLLDPENPRFAGELGQGPPQKKILDFIADVIGVADLLSSISQAGYHRAHPLIGIREGGKIVVVEGNRRLAATLILVGDERASNQRARASSYSSSNVGRLSTLPVLIAKDRREVLPYLGIAHIVGNKKWDSYAKAAWAADVVDGQLVKGGLKEIADQIGDKHRTLERLVEAFRVVRQLEDQGLFSSKDTFKKGKGIAKFPFSWVYTALGYQSIREWLPLEPSDEAAAGNRLLSEEASERAADLLQWMFGSRSKNQMPRIEESRQIADLAAALGSQRKLVLLKSGHNIMEVQEEVRPPDQKVAGRLLEAEKLLKEILGVIGASGRDLSQHHVMYLTAESRKVADAAVTVFRQIRDLSEHDYDQQLQ